VTRIGIGQKRSGIGDMSYAASVLPALLARKHNGFKASVPSKRRSKAKKLVRSTRNKEYYRKTAKWNHPANRLDGTRKEQ